MGKKVLDVGQCGFDGPRLRAMLREKVGAEVDCADTLAEALERASTATYDLVIVNRVLNYDRSSGLAVIEAIRKAHPKTKLMLVSDQAAAQDEAAKLGAVRGFGKRKLFAEETEALVCGELGGCD